MNAISFECIKASDISSQYVQSSRTDSEIKSLGIFTINLDHEAELKADTTLVAKTDVPNIRAQCPGGYREI